MSTRCESVEWDAFVSGLEAGHFMQSSAWGEFQRHQGWTPHYGTVREGTSLRAAILVLSHPVPGLGRRVFYAPRGPAVNMTDAAATECLFRELKEFVKRERGVFLRVDPYWTEADVTNRALSLPHLEHVPRDWSSWNAPRFVFWLDLTGDEDAVMARLTPGCRKDVRRGYRGGVEFSRGSAEDLEEFYRLMVLTGHQKGIAFHEPAYYRRLFEVVRASAKVQLFVGRFEGALVTAGVSVAYGRKSWLLYAATSPEHYKLRATRTLQWEMIRWAHEEGCTRYDFRGTATNDPPRETDPGYGVYEFKKSFGPDFIRLAGYYDLVSSPILHKALRLAEDHALPAVYRIRTWVKR